MCRALFLWDWYSIYAYRFGAFGYVRGQQRQRVLFVLGLDHPPELVAAATAGAESSRVAERAGHVLPGGEAAAALRRIVAVVEEVWDHVRESEQARGFPPSWKPLIVAPRRDRT